MASMKFRTRGTVDGKRAFLFTIQDSIKEARANAELAGFDPKTTVRQPMDFGKMEGIYIWDEDINEEVKGAKLYYI